MERLQILIKGQVQGVGFRPRVFHIAQSLQLTGWVKNNLHGVSIEVQGTSTDQFVPSLYQSLPPLAKIASLDTKIVKPIVNEQHFTIESSQIGEGMCNFPPDTSPCEDCLQELFNPKSRFYLYPFLNCTNCGPRYSITHKLPYDRCHTSMKEFGLCRDCEADYSSIKNRRFHAQPTACSRCGPRLSSSLQTMASALNEGKIVALKGVGGYQLLCDARNEQAILKLRQRKNRETKPFALMVLNCETGQSLVEIDTRAETLLKSPERPIVLLEKREDCLPFSIAPGLAQLGLMLPSSPLHYLIFHALLNGPSGTDWLNNHHPWVLVATSGNISDNPLILDDEEALAELGSVADLIISYNREIVTRLDDSIVSLSKETSVFVRRARGFVPESIPLAFEIPATLALGGQLKNTFCMTRGNEAFVSQHLGSLINKSTIDFFHETLSQWMKFLNVKIERLACDLHPNFYTTQLAKTYDLPLIQIQHHHAHLASVVAEAGLVEPTLGLALDGYGYGSDGGAWGGELMLLDSPTTFKRLGHFYPIPQLGGERAVYEPWRMAASILLCLNKEDEIIHRFRDQPQASLIKAYYDSHWNILKTSSCGRLFDAASALLGINEISQYEGQSAMLLESLVTELKVCEGGWHLEEGQLNFLSTFRSLLAVDSKTGANLFHGTLIAGLSEWIYHFVNKTGVRKIVLSGGCMINKVLRDGLMSQLKKMGLTCYLPNRLPANDAGLSLGQAWIAGNYDLRDDQLCA